LYIDKNVLNKKSIIKLNIFTESLLYRIQHTGYINIRKLKYYIY